MSVLASFRDGARRGQICCPERRDCARGEVQSVAWFLQSIAICRRRVRGLRRRCLSVTRMPATTENETIASSLSWLALCRDGENLGWKCLPDKRDWRTAEVQIVAWFLQ